MFDPELLAKAEKVVAANLAAGRTVALAESCTGGLVSAALTEGQVLAPPQRKLF